MIRNHFHSWTVSFSRRTCPRTFLTILNQRGNVAPASCAPCTKSACSANISPNSARLTCLVQHEFYHQYTADEHTLVCLEKLDQIAAATTPPFNGYTPLFHDLERPFLLYLALLLHDVGKADGHGKHSEVSSKLAARVARRLGLDGHHAHALPRDRTSPAHGAGFATARPRRSNCHPQFRAAH